MWLQSYAMWLFLQLLPAFFLIILCGKKPKQSKLETGSKEQEKEKTKSQSDLSQLKSASIGSDVDKTPAAKSVPMKTAESKKSKKTEKTEEKKKRPGLNLEKTQASEEDMVDKTQISIGKSRMTMMKTNTEKTAKELVSKKEKKEEKEPQYEELGMPVIEGGGEKKKDESVYEGMDNNKSEKKKKDKDKTYEELAPFPAQS